MAEQRIKPDGKSVEAFIGQIEDRQKRTDALALVRLMEEVSAAPPVMWGSMVGFGSYHYRYESGTEGDAFLIGFAPRKTEFSIYLMGPHEGAEKDRQEALLARLGKHRMGKACLYAKRLADLDMAVLRELVELSFKALREKYPQ